MDRNSSKPEETGNPHLYALRVTLDWLDREGGRQRVPTVLRALLEATETAIGRGEPPPEKDSVTLGEFLRLSRESERVAPLRSSEVATWWSSRQQHLRQACTDRGSEWIPELKVHTGGGRNLPSRFEFGFMPLSAPGETEPDPRASGEVGTGKPMVRYRIDPATPALWVRWIIGRRPFPINSWRGYVLLASMLANFLIIGLLWLTIYVAWLRPRAVTTADLAMVLAAGVVTVGLWALTRPIRLLPTHRVTMAGTALLAVKELHGQIRAMPDANRKGDGRIFSLVRHWGSCPLCSGEVDLDWGEAAFPDRLVGRCHDAPLEHVFSFDPVLLIGLPLR